MTNGKQKLHERNVLEELLPLEEFDEVDVERERPDAELRRHGDNHAVGVEIVRLFRNETSARLRNIPGYVSQLLHDEEFEHADDKERIDVETVTVLRGGDEDKKERIKGLITPYSPLQDFYRALQERLSKKNELAEGFDWEDSKPLFLAVDVRENFFALCDETKVAGICIRKSTLPSIRATPFDEIFLLTPDAEGEQIRIPLVQNAILADFKAYVHLVEVEGAFEEASDREKTCLLANYLDREYDHKTVSATVKDSEARIQVGRYCLELSEDSGVTIYDPTFFRPSSELHDLHCLPESVMEPGTVSNRIDSFWEENIFRGGVSTELANGDSG